MDDLISRREAIEALGEEPLVWCDEDKYAIGSRNQWRSDVAALKSLPPAQRWIPVSERLPESEYADTYLVSLECFGELEGCENEVAFASWTISKGWIMHDVYDAEYKRVTAWMEMLEPYGGR